MGLEQGSSGRVGEKKMKKYIESKVLACPAGGICVRSEGERC